MSGQRGVRFPFIPYPLPYLSSPRAAAGSSLRTLLCYNRSKMRYVASERFNGYRVQLVLIQETLDQRPVDCIKP
jgi:hypothetical protein